MSRACAVLCLLAGCQQIFGLEAPAHGTSDAAPADVSDDAALIDQGMSTQDTPPQTCDSTNAALRACYRFEGNINDDSSFGYDGGATNVTFGTGYDGQALVTMSGSAVSVAGGTGLDVTSLTIKMWINPSVLPAAGARMGLVDSAARYRMFLLEGGAVRCSVTGVGGVLDLISSTGIVATNVWTRVACTYDGSTLKLYANGALIASLAQTATINATGGGMVIAQNNPSGENFVGRVDALEIWGAVVAP